MQPAKVQVADGLNGACTKIRRGLRRFFQQDARPVLLRGWRGLMKCLKGLRRIFAGRRVEGLTPAKPRGNTMYRRLTLLVAAALIVSLSGCVIVPEHRHCCWRYYGAVDAPSHAVIG